MLLCIFLGKISIKILRFKILLPVLKKEKGKKALPLELIKEIQSTNNKQKGPKLVVAGKFAT